MSARTFVKQSQITGSLLSGLSYKNSVDHNTARAGGDLAGDLAGLASQVQMIIGQDEWYSDLQGGLSLAAIDGYFSGTLPVNNVEVGGYLNVTGPMTASAGLEVSGDTLTVTGTVNVGTIVMDSATNKITGLADPTASDGAATKNYVDNQVSSEASAARSAELVLTNDLSSEASAARSAELVLTNDLSSEASAARSAELVLTNSISSEASAARSAELVLTNDLSSEASAARSAELVLTNDLSSEASAARSAELVLTNDLSSEASAARSAELVLTNDLSSEASAARSAELVLTNDLSSEASAARSAELVLTNDLSSEASAARSAELVLTNDLSSEASAARSAELVLTNDLSSEASAARSAELVLTNDLSSEASAARSAELVLTNGLSSEASAARSAELVLTNDLSSEASAARSAELVLTNDLSTEVWTARSVETVLSNEISNEVSTIVAGGYEFDHLNITNDLTVGGNFYVSGAFTYIDTVNLKVKDALIHLNLSGSSALNPRGIVLHGAEAYDDLAFGAKPNSGDFVFAMNVNDSDVDIGNADVFAGSNLAAAWMKEVKFGAHEGELSGSLKVDGDNMKLTAANELNFSVGGNVVGVMSGSEYTAFDNNFTATTIVGALNELAAGGNRKQDAFAPGVVAADTAIAFTAVGTLRATDVVDVAAKKKAMDVYFNGIRLAYTDDYTVFSTTQIKLTFSTTAADRIYVVIHNAA